MLKRESDAYALLVAGALATIAFDSFGQGLSPLLGFANLAPVPLAIQSIQKLTGITSPPLGNLLHYVTGLVFYPLGWYLLAQPIQRKVMPNLHWLITSVVYGIVLWVFAMYFMATLVAGNPPFLGFTGITWVALWGHILFAVVCAWILEKHGARLGRT